MPTRPWKKKRSGVDEYGRSPLWHHAAEGDLPALEADLRKGADATAADKDGFTALHVAAQNGHAETVERLIEAGADVDAADRHGNGPLWTASREASLAIAEEPAFRIVAMLLNAGADPQRLNKADSPPAMWATASPELHNVYVAAGVSVPSEGEP